VATDVAAEGLNLQTSCRFVLHHEVPWNPMRLEQRNGRVDRHGQARDVTAFHFVNEQDEDTRFLDYVVRKVDRVRDDLGSVGEVIDRGLEEHFADRLLGEEELDRRVEQAREHTGQRTDLRQGEDPDEERSGEEAAAVLADTERALRIDAPRLERLLRVAAELDRGGLDPDGDGTSRLRTPPAWQRTVDSSLRLDHAGAGGALPRLAFDAAALTETVGERRVYRERADTRLLRLAHPVMRRATATLRRRLWEKSRDLRRFTIGAHPDVSEPTLVVSCLLSMVNELREPLHAELIELAVAADADELGVIAVPEGEPLAITDTHALDAWNAWLEDRWDGLAAVLAQAREQREEELREHAEELLPERRREERAYQDRLFRARLKELDDERGEKGRERLRRELDKAQKRASQLTLDEQHRHELEEDLRAARERLEGEEYRQVEQRRERLRERIERERDHLLAEVLPRRFALARCGLMPVAVALLVPEGTRP
jgi:hypothetical protein